MKRFLLFFVLILGFVSATFAQTGTVPEVDYSAMITTFAGFVGSDQGSVSKNAGLGDTDCQLVCGHCGRHAFMVAGCGLCR